MKYLRFGFSQLLMLLPMQLLIAAVLLIPEIWLLWMSMTSWSLGAHGTFVGLANYVYVFTDPYFWLAFVNTFVVVNVIVYAELALALLLAIIFVKGVPMRRLVVALLIAPLAVTEVVAIIIWKYMLEPDVGLISQALTMIGAPELPWTTDRWAALFMISLISIWMHLPFSFILLYSGLLGISPDLYESAAIDGVSPWQRLSRITIPLLMPSILIAMMFRYIFGFRIFGEVWILTGGGPARMTEVLATYLYRHAFSYQQFGVGAAIGWIMAIGSLAIASLYVRRMYKSAMTTNG